MKKTHVFGLLIGLLVVALFLSFFNKKESDAPTQDNAQVITINSNDGLAQLVIPAGAMPSNVSFEEITLTRLEGDDFPFVEDSRESIIVYNLEPNGLTFLEPITFTATINNNDGSIPLVFHLFEDEIDILDDVEVELELESNKATILAKISHFSVVGVGKLNLRFFKLEASASDTELEKLVPFQAAASIERTAVTLRYNEVFWNRGNRLPPGTKAMRFTLDPLKTTIYGEILPGPRGKLAPKTKRANRPKESSFKKNKFALQAEDFTCLVKGKDSLGHAVTLTWQQKTERLFWSSEDFQPVGKGRTKRTKVLVRTPNFECKEEIDLKLKTPDTSGDLKIRGGIFGE